MPHGHRNLAVDRLEKFTSAESGPDYLGVEPRGRNPLALHRPLWIYFSTLYILELNTMQVSRWGNSLAVRLPVAVVEALDLKEGEEIELHVAGKRTLEIARKPGTRELLARLRKYRGRLPADFKFDRLEAHERR